MKIFGDVFESLIAAVFLDSESLELTGQVFNSIIEPYVEPYGTLNNILEHPKTALMELWSQKPYMKDFRCSDQLIEAREVPAEWVESLGIP